MGNRLAARLLLVLGSAVALAGPVSSSRADPCPACHGTGRCPSCGGQGYISAGMIHGQPGDVRVRRLRGLSGNPVLRPARSPRQWKMPSLQRHRPGAGRATRRPGPASSPGPSPKSSPGKEPHAEAHALNEVGVGHFKGRRWREAIAAFTAALQKWPDNQTMRTNLLNAQERPGR